MSKPAVRTNHRGTGQKFRQRGETHRHRRALTALLQRRPPRRAPAPRRNSKLMSLPAHVFPLPPLISTTLGLPVRLVKTTTTDRGSPRAENYFANSRKQYFPHKQQQRQASLVAPASMSFTWSISPSSEDKGQDSTNSKRKPASSALRASSYTGYL